MGGPGPASPGPAPALSARRGNMLDIVGVDGAGWRPAGKGAAGPEISGGGGPANCGAEAQAGSEGGGRVAPRTGGERGCPCAARLSSAAQPPGLRRSPGLEA